MRLVCNFIMHGISESERYSVWKKVVRLWDCQSEGLCLVIDARLVGLPVFGRHFARTDVSIKRQGVTRGTIVIEDDCWLGANCSVLADVRISRGSIVATGAVVTRDVPPYSVVGGVPARVIKFRIPGDPVL